MDFLLRRTRVLHVCLCASAGLAPVVVLAQAPALALPTAPASAAPAGAAPALPPAETAPVGAPAPNAAPKALRSSTALSEALPPADGSPRTTFVSGDRTTGRPDLETVLEGNAQLRRSGLVIRADRLEYQQPEDLARARGNVLLNRAGNVYQGDELELRMGAFEGFFNNARYSILRNQSYGQASRIDFVGDKRTVVRDASYTTCQRNPEPGWMPDWVLNARTLRLDTEENVGVAESAELRFKNVPILPIPYLSFPLTEERKSGVLPPTFGADNLNGVETTVPYYWNIAPNRDATLYPTLMSKRGIDLGAEFRYLESDYGGLARVNYMPQDSLRDRSRWGLALKHSGTIETGLAGVGALGLRVDINRVSDDNYWRDFADASNSLTQRLLSSDAQLSWSRDAFSASLRTLKWQTLQDVGSTITPPYDRLPQLSVGYTQRNLEGFDVSVTGDYTNFRADTALTGQPNAKRSFALAQVSYPWLTPGWYLTPTVKLHTTRYEFSAPLVNGARSASRVVPSFNLDAGLVFERDASYFGRALRQTLEPRAFYSYAPFKDQSALPNYDSAANDFNFASIFSDTPFSGNDRIADNNLLTLGVTTRLLDTDTGAETARFTVAQRLRITAQQVTLPGGVAATDRLSDVLAGASINWDPRWSLDSTLQYNPKAGRSARATVGARYSPGTYRVINGAYRYQRDASEQFDVSWQWPLNDLWGDRGQDLGAGRGQGEGRWYSVGRLNYSVRDGTLVDGLLGVEYDAGCWLGRVVVERLQRSSNQATQRILFQMEFVGFSRLGTNPLKTLRSNIPRYQNLRERTTTPSRFSAYD